MQPSITDLIRSRRTIHQFRLNKLPAREQIMAAIELAIWAPNHYATQPWYFYILGDEAKEKICQLNAELIRQKRGDQAAQMKLDRWREIPGWLVLTCDVPEQEIRARENYAACCCAAQNFMLYCWSIGIGVKWTTGDVIRDKRFHKILGIKSSQVKVVGLFWYGYPEVIPQTTRKPVDEVVTELP